MSSTAALPTRTDVAIVGAGPTGLALAVTLARAGVDFVLLDRQAEGANTSRAAVVHARTLEVLDELDPVFADVVMDWAPGRREVSLAFGAAGLTVVAPLPAGRYRIVTTVDEAPAEPDLAFVQALLDERVPGQATVRELVRSSRFRIHHRVADHYRAGRLLLAGDAAHVHSPAGGQGMNTGIQDGHALGQVLADGLDLDRYEARRRPVALRVVALTDRMTRIATTRNRALRTVRNTLLPVLLRIPALHDRLANELAELDYR
ncbi:FAD-dependent oxidoreductase [Streptomyces sp. NPDC097617]|uniref:FAD-dependent oxidoreductase n=1 Tax=Streptomyces sp. NPDC097617 TaxID=3366091 RepID=UPI0038201B4D